MSDRLTQLQICTDQLLEQFTATLNYVNSNHDFISANGEERLVEKDARVASSKDFEDTINELSRDIILKTRQIFTIIESLPGVGVSLDSQVNKIQALQTELVEVEKKRVKAIKDKDDLVQWCDDLMVKLSNEIVSSL